MPKIVLVTGGSRGIGAATCRLAASRGYAVCLSYRTRADLAAGLVADIGATGETAVALGAGGEYVDYAASKGALDAMTKGLAQEVAPEGIRVNAVRPGYIHTDIHASGGEPDRVDRVKGGLPLRREGTPEEVALAILWLLSDESSFTTGSFVEVAGGR